MLGFARVSRCTRAHKRTLGKVFLLLFALYLYWVMQADAREEAAGGGSKKTAALPRAKRRRVGSSSGSSSRVGDGAEVPNGRL